MREAAREAVGEGDARIHVIAVNTAGSTCCPALIQAYRDAAPSVQVLLEVGNRRDVIDRLRSHTADLGVAGRPPAGDIVGRAFAHNELIVVGCDPDGELVRGAVADARIWLGYQGESRGLSGR